MLGAVVANDPAIIQSINDTHYAMGYSISADDAWLAIRGVRTLPIRMNQSAQNALEVCRFLAARPEVVRIYHPALPTDPGHALWQRDRSEEHTSELQSLMRISYAVFCLKKQKTSQSNPIPC